jgi:hypothetical protein
MGWAAQETAAGGQAALTVECTTDTGTLARVADKLRPPPGSWPPALVPAQATAPAPVMDRRTVAQLGYAARHRRPSGSTGSVFSPRAGTL